MDLNLIEKFVLLSLNPKKGKFLIDSLSLNYGLAGAILLEMSELNKIVIENKRLVLLDSNLMNDTVIDACIKLINNSKKPRNAKYWINKIGNNSTGFKKQILNILSNKQIIKIRRSTFIWGLFKNYSYPVINYKLVDEQKTKLKQVVIENKKTDLESILLLSLMNSCKLTRLLFINKKEHNEANKRIKELTRNIEISNAVGKTLKEIQTAVLLATTSAFIGSTTS